MYKACIFDMDGTILNTLDSIAYFGNTALERMGYPPIPVRRYKQLVGNGVNVLIRRVLEEAGAGYTEERAYELLAVYNSLYEKDPFYLVHAYDGIAELLQKCKVSGVKLGVLSNKPDNMTRFIADKFFPGLFDIVQGQKEDIPLKPDPAGLNAMIHSLGIPKNDVLYCGDSGVDMQTGKNAGVMTAGVLWGFRDEKELHENGALYLVSTADELEQIIFSA